MKRWMSLLALIILFAIGLPQTSFADDEEGVSSLEKGDPVRHQMLFHSGRFELQPLAQFGVNETFQQSIGFGITLAYYFRNDLGIGASFSYNPIFIDGDELDAVKKDEYDDGVQSTLTIAQPTMNFDVSLYYMPAIGKFSLFKWILNYDLHVSAGFGAIIMDSVCGSGGADCNDAKNNNLEGAKFAGVIGVGVRFFFNNFVALNLDIKNYLTKYADFSRGPADDRARFKDFVVGTVGVSIFLPTSVYMSR